MHCEATEKAHTHRGHVSRDYWAHTRALFSFAHSAASHSRRNSNSGNSGKGEGEGGGKGEGSNAKEALRRWKKAGNAVRPPTGYLSCLTLCTHARAHVLHHSKCQPQCAHSAALTPLHPSCSTRPT